MLTSCVNNNQQATDNKKQNSENSIAAQNDRSDDTATPENSADNSIETETNTTTEDVFVAADKLPYAATSLWPIIIKHYKLDKRVNTRLLKNDVAWFKRNPKFLRQSMQNSRRYLYYITGELASRNMPGELALLPMIESNYKPTTRAVGGHEGLWQFARGTGKRMGLEYNWWYNGSYDVVASTDAALDYMEKLARHYDGDWLLAMAAYNCGSGTLDRIIERNRRIDPHKQFWQLPLPGHTRDHLKRLLALSYMLANPKRYGIEPLEIENRQYFYAVTLDEPVDMVTLAHLGKTSLAEIQLLNTGFLRDSTDPLKKRRALLPVNSPRNIPQLLAELPQEQRFNWPRHTIASNDSLAKIARRYGTTIATLRQMNGMTSKSVLRSNQTLLVPSTRASAAIALDDGSDRRKKKSARANNTGDYHRVSSGESLWTIARQYDVSVSQLLKWNQLKEGQVLKIGQKLRIKQ